MIFYTFIGVYFLLCASPSLSVPLHDVLQSENFQSSGLSFCNTTATRKTDAIILEDADLRDGQQCYWCIFVANATSISLLFLPLPPQNISSPRGTNAGASAGPVISVHTTEPGQGQGEAELTWTFLEERTVQTFNSSQIWVLITPKSSQYDNEHNRTVAISFMAQQNGEIIQKCSSAGPSQIDQGSFSIIDRAFGSVALLTCNAGFIVPSGSPQVSVCIARQEQSGHLSNTTIMTMFWSQPQFVCQSVCNHPPYVAHAVVDTTRDSVTHFSRHTQEQGMQNQTSTNSTARYTCELPYVMYPFNHTGILSCKSATHTSAYASTQTTATSESDTTSQARNWNPQVPSCIIPDCSSTVVLSQHNGAIVNPSYPSRTLLGGSLQCRWEINAPSNSYIQITTQYIDLPASDPSTKVEIFDEGLENPAKLLSLTGHREGFATVTSNTSKIVVTYNGPAANISGHRGFYLEYAMRASGSKLRIGEPKVTNSTEAKAPAGQSSTSADLSTGDKDKTSGDASLDDGIIAVSVIVPLLALVLILVGGYFWYRRRYPVRMIIGRDVSKFTNPKYAQPRSEATLVRDDAERFFTHTPDDLDPSDTTTLEMNPISVTLEQYDNRGYQSDEFDKDGTSIDRKFDEDEEEERRFRETKSWLFRRSDDRSSEKMRATVHERGTLSSTNSDPYKPFEKPRKSYAEKVNHSKCSENANSIGSDISELLNEQQVTPRRFRRGLSRDTTTESSSTTGSAASVHSVNTHDENSKPGPVPDVVLPEGADEENTDSSAQNDKKEQAEEKVESSSLKAAKTIFEQRTLEQVMAEVKARSRSLSVGTIKPDLNSRQRSYSVDPSKSARKYSLHDEAVLAAYVKSMDAPKIVENPISSASSHHSMDSSKLPLTAQSSLSASIVGVDIKVKISSSASTASGGSSVSIHSIDGSEAEERNTCLSLVSANSNPHLVTDLDNISQNSEDGREPLDVNDEAPLKDEEENSSHKETGEVTSNANIDSSLERVPDEMDLDHPDSVREMEENENGSLKEGDKDENISKKKEDEQGDLVKTSSRSLDNVKQEPAYMYSDKLATAQKEKSDSGDEEPNSFSSPEVIKNNNSEESNTFQDNYIDSKDAQVSLAPSISNLGEEKESSYLGQETVQDVPSVFGGDIKPDSFEQITSIKPEDVREATTDKSPGYKEDSFEKERQSSDENRLQFALTDKNKAEHERELEDETPKEVKATNVEQTTQENESTDEDEKEETAVSKNLSSSETKSDIKKVTNGDQVVSGEESSDDSTSDTSESDGSGVKASYDFGGGVGSDEEQDQESSEDDPEFGVRSTTEDVASADSINSVDHSETAYDNLLATDASRLSLDSDSGHNQGSTSASGPSSLSVNLSFETSPKRVKILPLVVNLSDDDDSDDDADGDESKEKYKFSDDDMSDILGASSDENEVGEFDIKDSSEKLNQPAFSPSTYTFQQHNSDDDDIDV